jgi:CTP synthase
LSVVEAIKHGALAHDAKPEIVWIASDDLTDPDAVKVLEGVDGVLVPGGFGIRGIEGKLAAVRYARETGTPYLGLCLGQQCAVIEFARDVCGLEGANSSEFDPTTPHPVIDLMADQTTVESKGGTMRLGLWACKVEPDTKAHLAYGKDVVLERHRHRYEVSNRYRRQLEGQGMVVSGTTVEGKLVEIIELADHPWFVASQFHPEFKSRPTRPHPLFRDFIGAAIARSRSSVARPQVTTR